MNEVLLKNFELDYPRWSERVVNYRTTNAPWELIFELDDGQVMMYDMMERICRRLPSTKIWPEEGSFNEDFGWRLRRAMAIRGVSQEELADRTNMSQATISHYVMGKRSPSFYNIDRIAKALDCSIDELRYLG